MQGDNGQQPSLIFVDTNTLDQAWPELSGKMRTALESARLLNITVELPDPVLLELDNRCKERIRKHSEEIKTSLRNLRRLGIDIPQPPLEANALFDRYLDRRSHALTHFSRTTPFVSCTIDELFREAIGRKLLFGEQGRNFQDVVIYRSVIERLKTHEGGRGVLVTKDSVFSERREQLREREAEWGVSVEHMSLDDVERLLTERLGGGVRERLTTHREAMTALLESSLSEVCALLDPELAMDYDESQLYNLLDVELEKVIAVEVPVMDADPPVPSRVRAAATLRGFGFLIERQPNRTLGPEEVTVDVEVEFTATWSGDSYSMPAFTLITAKYVGQSKTFLYLD